jgi:putative phosphoesterase
VRVAALYDVHGNLPALKAVLAELDYDAVDAIVIGGDVAAGPFPSETIDLLRSLGDRVRWLRGNADRELAPGEEGNAPPELIDWIRARLSEDQIAFLHGLPEQLALDIDGLGRVLFVHATPRNDTEIFTAITPDERVAPVLAGVDADVMVCGHTHVQFDRVVDGVRIVNAGSVGMPYEDEPGAYWLRLGPAVEHRRTLFEPAPHDFPGEWPSATRDEATELFERSAI